MFGKISYLLHFLLLLETVSRSYARVIEFTKPSNSRMLPPVVFIPGDGASKLDARLNLKKASPNCPLKRDWFRLWLNLEELLPNKLPCLTDALSLEFDPLTNRSKPATGVDIRIPQFGTSSSLEYIDDSFLAKLSGVGDYAHELVKALLSFGERDVTVRGAPYDFRLSMSSQTTYFDRLKQLIEETYTINDHSKVALIGHSLGGWYTTWFLNKQSQEWKDKYILSFISVSTPWGGSTESLQSIVSGFSFNHPKFIKPLVVRKEQRTFETDFMLLPNAKVWPSNELLVLTDQKNYTASQEDTLTLLKDIGVSDDVYRQVTFSNQQASGTPLWPHVGVKTYCIYGTGISTNHALDYRGKRFPDGYPDMVTVPGDGTVSHQSLSVCQGWNLGKRLIEVPSADHNSFLQDRIPLSHVVQAVFDSNH